MNISQSAFKCIERGDLLGVSVSVQGVNGSLTLDDSDISGLEVSRMSVLGDKLELGSAISSELKLKLYNDSGKFNDFLFEGAEIYLRLAVKLDSGLTEYIPMGYFTADEQPRHLSTISLSALDRMARFDRPYDTALSYPATLYQILSDTCSKCGVPLKTLSSELTNAGYLVQNRPESDGLTYHQVIIWIAQLTGTCAWIDWDGKLRLTWYETSNTKLTPNNLTDLDIQEKNITVTGVQIVANDEDGTPFLSGTDVYAFNIVGNLLAQADLQSIANALGDKLIGFTYRPYKCTSRELPHLWQMERITLTDVDGQTYSTIINQHNYTLGGKSDISAKGQTAKRKGYSTGAPLTARERAVLERLQAKTNRKLSDQQQSQLSLNESIANSFGLYQTAVKQPDNSVKVYWHDKPLLEESEIIYTMTSGGFAWTKTGWNGGNPVWHYGVDKDGNAVINTIIANKLWAELIVSGRLQSKDGSNFLDLDTGLAQFIGKFTAKSQSVDPLLDVSAALRGFSADLSDPDNPSAASAGVIFEDAYGKLFADLIGIALGSLKILQLRALNSSGQIAAQLQLTSSGIASVMDSSGSGRILHTESLKIEVGYAGFQEGEMWQANGGWESSREVYPSGSFGSSAVPVVTINTGWAGRANATCTRADDAGNFTVHLHRPDRVGTSVCWIIVQKNI